ncbi:MAG: type II secretion system protein [Azospirillaceae bacterium]|nr:type II secretion system protein [Azospirillaceae bacterium]
MPSLPRPSGVAGFTLLEMLIALAIFGLGTALLMQSAWSGAWAARQAWTETAALRLAQSAAAEAGVARPITQGVLDFTEEGLPYRVKIVPLGVSGTGDLDFRVEVRASPPASNPDAAIAAGGSAGPVLATVTNRSVADNTR